MKRYGYYTIKDAKSKLAKLQKLSNKMGRKVDLTALVSKHKHDVPNNVEAFNEDFSKLYKIRTEKDIERYYSIYVTLTEIMYDYYYEENAVHLWVDRPNIDKLSVGSLDFKLWERAKNLLFTLETESTIKTKSHEEDIDVVIRVQNQQLSKSGDVIQFGVDYYSEKYGFECVEPCIIDFKNKKAYVKKFREEDNDITIYIDDIEARVVELPMINFDTTLQRADGYCVLSAGSLVIALQNAMKEYFNCIDAVKTITTVSGAKRKLQKIHEPRVKVIERQPKTSEDHYILVSELAIRKVYEKKPYQGGHHASPIPHDVKGHWRTYKNGKQIWVKGYHKESKSYKGNTTQNIKDTDIYVVGNQKSGA